MNESFLHFYKHRLKSALKSARLWIEVIVLFVVYIFLFKQSRAPSVFAYVCNIGMVVAAFVFVDVIFAYVSWVMKNSKIKKSNK